MSFLGHIKETGLCTCVNRNISFVTKKSRDHCGSIFFSVLVVIMQQTVQEPGLCRSHLSPRTYSLTKVMFAPYSFISIVKNKPTAAINCCVLYITAQMTKRVNDVYE